MIRLEQFERKDYKTLIDWVASEEELMQFAGPQFHFPLTPEQLDTSLSDENRIAFVVIDSKTKQPIGHSELYKSENSIKLSRILIGEKELRGKGYGKKIVEALLDYMFSKFQLQIAELNVFDWNIGAIKCYEKVGFKLNENKRLERQIKGQTWIAINMTLTREVYEQRANHR